MEALNAETEAPRVRIVDLETRSLCDLKKRGGSCYSEDPTTELLTVAWQDTGGPRCIWFPRLESAPAALIDLHLPGATVYFGDEVPEPLLDTTLIWVAHNGWGFDEPVWNEQMRRRGITARAEWDDSACQALQSGLPGGLNNLSIRLWGEGKYEEGSNALKDASKKACDPPVATWLLIGKYNLQDVDLTTALWEHLRDYPATEFERRVQWAHRRINNRGVRLDQGLTAALMRLSNEAVDAAVTQIAELTKTPEHPDGFLATHDHLRSRTRMMEWLDLMGADVGKGKGKVQKDGSISRSITKQVIAQWIDATVRDTEGTGDTAGEEEEDTEDTGVGNLLRVVEVLQLREAAMRVTAGKLVAAGLGCAADGYLRAIIAYFAAHTGRFGGRRFQPQNLPRPKEGVDFWGLVRLYEEKGILPVPDVLRIAEDYLALLKKKDPATKAVLATLDDSASALLRAILLPSRPSKAPGHPTEEEDWILAGDLVSIESRILAWLADETWKMASFFAGEDPYIALCKKSTGKTVTKTDPIRQAFKILELSAGFQGGVNTVSIFAAMYGVDFALVGMTPQSAVDAWRDANPAIAGEVVGMVKGRKWRRGGFWNDCMAAAVSACEGTPVQLRKLYFYKRWGNLHVRLPSGRELIYRGIRLGSEIVYGKARPTLTYSSPRWLLARLYGGAIAQNITQAVARDVMAHGIVQLEEAGLPVILHVHDEAATSAPATRFPEFMECLTRLPEWLTDFPLDAEGGCFPRYAKKTRDFKEQVYRNGVKL